MAGYCTTCGGSGFRRPAQEKTRADLVDEIASMAIYDEFSTEEAKDALNNLIRQARRITRKVR